MMACWWIFIYGIIFGSVNCESGLAPHHHEPLKKLLKRTITHVKLFLGDFERKIKDSRHIVGQIHNQSVLSDNLTRTNIHNINTFGQPTLINQERDAFGDALEAKLEYFGKFILNNSSPLINREADELHASAVEYLKDLELPGTVKYSIEEEFIPTQSSVASPFPNIPKGIKHSNYFIRQGPVRLGIEEEYTSNVESSLSTSTTLHPKNLIQERSVKSEIEEKLRNILMFTSRPHNSEGFLNSDGISPKLSQRLITFEIEEPFKQKLVDTNIFVRGITPISTDVITLANARKKPTRAMRLRPERFTAKNDHKSQQDTFNTVIFMRGMVASKGYIATVKPKHLPRDYTIQPFKEKGIKKYSQNVEKDIRKVFGNIKHVKKVSSTKVTDKTDFKRRKSTEIVKYNKTQKARPFYTLSNFHSRLKGEVFSERTADYPDIFYRLVTTLAPTTVKASTTPKLTFLSTESTTKYIRDIVPELTNDYRDFHFRAESSDADNAPPLSNPKPETLNPVSYTPDVDPENLSQLSQESKTRKSAPNIFKRRHDYIENENLRRIIDPSSYSFSNEEAIIRVNLLDQMYHYNKSAHENV